MFEAMFLPKFNRERQQQGQGQVDYFLHSLFPLNNPEIECIPILNLLVYEVINKF